ncbi:MAG: MDR family MFS transporter [Promethearchaeota archaeon]
MFSKIKRIYNEYPNPFKVLLLATFIDRFGGFLLFPFFSYYIIDRFGVGGTQVGFLITMFSAGSIVGGILGGALADKYGRRSMVVLGLISSGIGSILMGLVDNLYLFLMLAGFLGILGNIGGPARQAMVADLLPSEKRARGFGLLRVAVNLSATFGPILGGFLATHSYLSLFIADAISSLFTALIVILVIPETKPNKEGAKTEETVMKTFIGYKEVLKDSVYIIFLAVSALTVIVYMQMNTTLPYFLKQMYGFTKTGYGLLLSMNAVMVVIFQFGITKRITKYDPMKMMAFGTFLYMIGFGMYGFISEIYLFFIAMAILTIGEMIVIPVSQATVTLFAPEDKRGRYMAIYGFHWSMPNLFGVLAAGLVYDYIGPNWVWYLAGILCLISVIGFLLLHSVVKERISKETERFIDNTENYIKLT